MSLEYVNPSGLKHYDEKIKEYINNKTFDSGESYDDTELRGLISDLEDSKVEKEEGKGLFSGSYNDLTDKPTIPSVDDFVSEETLNDTLSDYAKQSDIPTSLPASDVFDWAKSETKPTYTASEVGADTSGSASKALSDAKEYVDTKIDGIVGEGASTTLDTIGELSKAIEEHQDVTDALNSAIGNKVDKVSGKGLSTNDYTTAEKTKLAGIAEGANKTTVDSALSSTSTNPVQNKVINSALSGKASTSVATTSANGLMSSTDKAKLDAITASADSVSVTQKLTSGTEIGTVTVNGTGTKLYAPTNTDTHYTSKNVVGSSTATDNTTSALTNGNVYLNSVENGAVTSSHKISGSGATTVTTDTSGNIVISSTDTNTVTTVSTTGSGNAITALSASNGAITVTKGSTFLTAHPTVTKSTDSTSTASPAHGETFTVVDSVTSDSNGHVTKVNTKTVTLPSSNSTDTKVTNTLNTTTKAYVTGTTSSYTNTGTQIFDTGVYLGTGTGQLNLVGSSSTNYSINSQVLNVQIPSYTNSLYGVQISPYNTDNSNYLTGLNIGCGTSTGPGMRAINVACSADNYMSTVNINRSGTNSYALQVPNGKSYIATIYSNSSAITTSDREKKTDIKDIPVEYEELFFKLQPRLFKFKDGTSGRIHVGAVAQEVEEALNEVGISDTEFAGFVRQEKDYVVNEETGEVTQEEGYDYYLRYEEFVMLICHMLQKLYVEKEEQDNKISELESRIVALESKLS